MINPEKLWYGSYLKREQVKVLRASLEKMFAPYTDIETKLKAEQILNQFDLASSNERGDMFQFPDPETLKFKLREVPNHQSDFRKK